MSFSSDLKEELLELKMWDNKSNLPQDEQIARLCVREAFIKGGFINNPNRDYHLEMLFEKKKKAEQIQEILKNFNINTGITQKNNGYILYIKDGEEISDFLALIGANRAVLKFEEIRVIKETRNNINRLVNCETANLNKTINASVDQIKAINIIKENNQFKLLPDALQEIAELRLKHPEMSYEELGKLLKKQIGKSGVSHRLNKIIQISKEIKR